MRLRHTIPICLGLACQAQRQAGPGLPPLAPSEVVLPSRPASPAQPTARVQPRTIDAAGALADGYTIIDLSDDFAPFLFADHALPSGEVVSSHYRRTFVGLANDRLDGDGQPLAPGSKNYLELYGIFPSLSVLRARFLEDAGRSCLPGNTRAALEQAAARRGSPGRSAIAALERRLHCEGLLTPALRHRTGRWDQGLQQAIRRFQMKHMIYEAAHLRRETARALARDLLENNHRALLRALRERVVAATGIIEDGTVSRSVLGASANLADRYTEEVARVLGLDTPEGALAFFNQRQPADFARLHVGVRLPPQPDYYGQMTLKLVIDRGDVYFDLPFDETGRRIPQPRRRFPSLSLIAEHGGKSLPLVRWRTTIGGWRLEQASDGYDYYRYKGSDVGSRVIRQIVAGPAWLAPPGTPVRSLVKWKPVNGASQPVVNYATLGPGHLSAYGLVAGYLVQPGRDGRPDRDSGIRAHGSAEYLSMYSADGYSHGCHRLPNHLAIRLFSFLLQRRPMRAVGELEGVPPRQFLVGNRVFEIQIPSRGFAYELDPPLEVEVRPGQIKGILRQPIREYVPRPGVRYPGQPPLPPGTLPEPIATAPTI